MADPTMQEPQQDSGHVMVVCRFRPENELEQDQSGELCVKFPEGEVLLFGVGRLLAIHISLTALLLWFPVLVAAERSGYAGRIRRCHADFCL